MEVLVANRSDRGKLRFTGPQDAWFLHQILTQDFEGMPEGEAREAAQLTAHGRMVGYFEFVRSAQGFLCHFEPTLKETYPAEVARYVFATQVTIEDISESWGLILVVGPTWRDAGDLFASALPHPTRGLGTEAGYLWVPASEIEAARAKLVDEGATLASEEELEAIRISNGAPRWGWDMDNKTIPQEVGIEEWAVDFNKGCYVGQEAMAKIHFRGKVNRRLARLSGRNLARGHDVTADSGKVGTVTSVAEGAALAIVRHTIEPGTSVSVSDAAAEVVG